MRTDSKELAQLFFKLLRHKNGVISDSMIAKGTVYERNYGVPLLEIKRIAAEYFPNHELALKLFKRKERECKLAAVYVDNPAEVSAEQMDDWSLSFNNPEITEQVCWNLLSQTPLAAQQIDKWIKSEDKFLLQAAFNMFSKLIINDDEFVERLIGQASDLNYAFENVELAAINAFVQFARRNAEYKGRIAELAKLLSESANTHTKFVGEEIIAFLG